MMKMISFLLIFVLLACLCACVPAEPERTTSTEDMMGTTTAEDKSEVTTIVIESTQTEASINKADPYAFVIKEAIDKGIGVFGTYATYYALYEIDDNGAEELLLGAGFGDSSIVLLAVYTIQGDDAVRQEALPGWMKEHPPILLFKNGTIRSAGMNNEGILSHGYYRFEAGEINWKISLNINYGEYFSRYPDDATTFVSITKGEYDRLQKEYEGDGQLAALDWKPLEEYGR